MSTGEREPRASVSLEEAFAITIKWFKNLQAEHNLIKAELAQVKVERDGARAALEDRDKMHAQHIHQVEVQRLKLEAELAQVKADGAAIANIMSEVEQREHLLKAENARLRSALKDVWSWIIGWSPDFTRAVFWPETEAKVHDALKGGKDE